VIQDQARGCIDLSKSLTAVDITGFPRDLAMTGLIDRSVPDARILLRRFPVTQTSIIVTA